MHFVPVIHILFVSNYYFFFFGFGFNKKKTFKSIVIVIIFIFILIEKFFQQFIIIIILWCMYFPKKYLSDINELFVVSWVDGLLACSFWLLFSAIKTSWRSCIFSNALIFFLSKLFFLLYFSSSFYPS